MLNSATLNEMKIWRFMLMKIINFKCFHGTRFSKILIWIFWVNLSFQSHVWLKQPLTSSLSKWQSDSPMGLSISKVFPGSKKFQKLLWVHINYRPSKPTINFLEMPIPMGESLCLLARLDVKFDSVLTKYIYYFMKCVCLYAWVNIFNREQL